MKIKKIAAAICAASVLIGCLPQMSAIDLFEKTRTGSQTLSDHTNNYEIGSGENNELYASDNQFKDCACSLSDEMRKKYEEDNTLESRIEFMKSLTRPQKESLLSADGGELDLQNATSLADIKNKDSFLYQNCPTTGDVKALVFLVDFADMRNEDSELTAEEVEKRLEGRSDAISDYYGPYTSVSGYYKTSSYGKFNIDFDVYGWYNSENNRSFYENAENPDDYSGNNVLIEEVMAHYDDSIDFSEYDANKDGLIDLVYFMYSGADTGWGSQWWSYVTQFASESTYDEEGIAKYCFVNLSSGAFGVNVTVIHESGHLLGLADYYNVESQSDTLNTHNFICAADMMSHNEGDHNIFSKMLLGWVEPKFVTESMSFDVLCSAENEPKAYVVAPEFKNGVFGEYFIIEYYKSNKGNYIKGTYCPEGAIRIYHIDASLYSNAYYYTYENTNSSARPLIMLMDSSGNDYAPLYGDDLWATHYYTEGMALGVNTAPSSELYDGIFSGINIHIDKLSEDTASVSVDFSESDSEAPKLRESRIPNVLGKALSIGGTEIFFTSNIYEGENLNKISIAPTNEPSNQTYLNAVVKKYTSSPNNCTSSIRIYTTHQLEANTEYLLTIPVGTVTDSSGNPNEEINITLTSVGENVDYSEFILPDLMLVPEGMLENAEIVPGEDEIFQLSNGNLICIQRSGVKAEEDNVYNSCGMVYKIFTPEKKLICNKNIADANIWGRNDYDISEIENCNVLILLDHKFYVIDQEGNIVNTDTYLPAGVEANGWPATHFRRGDSIDVIDKRYITDETDATICFVCRIGSDGNIVERFDLTESNYDIASYAEPDTVAKYYNEDYTIFNENAYSSSLKYSTNSINETKYNPYNNIGRAGFYYGEYFDGTDIKYANNIIHPGFFDRFVAIHDVQETIAKVSSDNVPILEIFLSDYLGNTLSFGSCIVLDDNSIIMTFPIWIYLFRGYELSGNNFALRLNSELEPIWSCVVPFEVSDAITYGDDILVFSGEKVYLFDESNKTSTVTHETYNVSKEYDYDSEQNIIYSSEGKTAAQLREAIECNNADVTVYDKEGKIAKEGKTLSRAVVEVKAKNSLYSVYYSFLSDYDCYEWYDGTLSITNYNGKSSNVVIPPEIDGKKVEGISSYAFWYSDSLVSVEIPQGINIAENAFCGCSSLALAKISENTMFAMGEVFKDCSPNLTIYGYTNSQADYYAQEYNIKFVPIDDSSKIQIDGGTVVTIPENSDADMSGKTLNVSQTEVTENAVTYDIVLKDEDSNEVQPGGIVEVKIPVPAGFDGENCYVYHKGENGFLTDMGAKYESGCMVFATDHFSEYVVTTEVIVPDILLGDVDGNNTVNTSDALMAIRAFFKKIELTPAQFTAADVDGNGKVDTNDALLMIRIFFGKI